jgi:hypothetical protein
MAYTSPTITTSGSTFAQLQARGLTGLVEAIIAANPPTAAPTAAPTLTATGGASTGGTLQAGTYYAVFSETNGTGETTVSPVSAQLTVAAGNIPQATFPSLQSGNTARTLYLTAVGGVNTGPFYRYVGGVTTTTTNLATAYNLANSFAYQPPTVNNTGFNVSTGTSVTKLRLLRAFNKNNGQQAYDFLSGLVGNFNRGQPVDAGQALRKVNDAHTVFAALAEACVEVGTLIEANTGHLANVATGIGGMKQIRQWP